MRISLASAFAAIVCLGCNSGGTSAGSGGSGGGQASGGTVGSITGNVVDNANFAFNRSDNLTYAGNISGSGSITKYGAGALTLSGSNSFAGGTFINSGTLVFNSLNNIGTGPISSWNSVPLRTGARGAASARRNGQGRSESAPAAAAACMKRRRVGARGGVKGFIDRLPLA